jgi:hypothetical protein
MLAHPAHAGRPYHENTVGKCGHTSNMQTYWPAAAALHISSVLLSESSHEEVPSHAWSHSSRTACLSCSESGGWLVNSQGCTAHRFSPSWAALQCSCIPTTELPPMRSDTECLRCADHLSQQFITVRLAAVICYGTMQLATPVPAGCMRPPIVRCQ